MGMATTPAHKIRPQKKGRAARAATPARETMGASDFKAHCLQILDRVAREKVEIVITKRGRPVAKPIPVQPAFDRAEAEAAARRILERSKHLTLGGLRIKDLINEGRP